MEQRMIVEKEEKVFVIVRPSFPGDLRRHFVGVVDRCTEQSVRITGYAFVRTHSAEFVRKPERRTRIFSLVDAKCVVNVLPEETEIRKVRYELLEGCLVLTDGKALTFNIDEFRAA